MRSQFKIKPQRMRYASDEMHGQASADKRIADEISGITRKIRAMSSMENVCKDLGQIEEEIRCESDSLSKMAETMYRIAAAYDRTEANICRHAEKSGRQFPKRSLSEW